MHRLCENGHGLKQIILHVDSLSQSNKDLSSHCSLSALTHVYVSAVTQNSPSLRAITRRDCVYFADALRG